MNDCVERTIDLPADLDEVWRTVTEPERLAGWLADEIAWDPIPGGDARFLVDGEHREGWVEEISPPHDGAARVSFWWQADGESASRVSLELSELEHGTRLRVREARPLESFTVVEMPIDTGGAHGGPMMIAA